MKRVEFGKAWKVTNVAEYNEAIKTLEENAFCARMSDDFRRENEELNEVYRQRIEVLKQVAAWEV